ISREMLSERHARAVLALPSEAEQLDVLKAVKERGLNVAQTEALVQRLLGGGRADGKKAGQQSIKGVYKDYRLLRNSVKQLVEQMKAGGAHVDLAEVKEADFVEIHIRIHT